MALSYTQWQGDGTTQTFSISFPYLDRAHVEVRVALDPVAFSWDDTNTVRVTPAPAAGAVVEARRVTPRDTRLVDFSDGSTLTETDLDLSATQTFYIVQEAIDIAGGTLELLSDGSYGAGGRRIKNVGTALEPRDAITKEYHDGTFIPQMVALLNQTTAARGEAVSARGDAVQARADAVAALAAAVAARDVAIARAEAANTSAGLANTRAGDAEAARATAVGAAGTATGAATTATNALTDITAKASQVNEDRGVVVAARQATETARDVAVQAAADAVNAATGPASGITVAPTGNLTQTNVQAALVAHQLAIDGAGGSRNLIVNSSMNWSQEMDGAVAVTITNGSTRFLMDQWEVALNTPQSITGGITTLPTPGGNQKRARLTITTARTTVAATDLIILRQRIEGSRINGLSGWGTAAAKPLTLRFGFKSNATGTFTVAIRNPATTRSYLANVVVGTGETNLDLVKTITIPAETSGVWPTADAFGLEVVWCIMAGSNFIGTPDAWNTTSRYGTAQTSNFQSASGAFLEVFDVALHVGASAPTYAAPDPFAEWPLVARYYETMDIRGTFTASAASDFGTVWLVPMRKRATPAGSSFQFIAGTNAMAYGINPKLTGCQVYWQAVAAGNSVYEARYALNSRM